MRVVICDRNERDRLRLAKVLKGEAMRDNLTLEISCCSPQMLSNRMEKAHYDIWFLDMASEGHRIAQWLRAKNEQGWLVFMSENPEDILEILDLCPLCFIDKTKMWLGVKVSLCLLRQKTGVRSMFEFPHGLSGNRRIVSLMDVMYIASNNHELTVQMADGQFRQYGSLSELEETLERYGFIRIHKSFLVNGRHIREMEGNEVVMTDHVRLPVARSRSRIIRDWLLTIDFQRFNC